jgi:hypothetical protein
MEPAIDAAATDPTIELVVQNLVIEIPGTTSRTLYEPTYAIPLIELMFDNSRRTAGDKVRVRMCDPNSAAESMFRWRPDVTAQGEYDRLRNKFLVHPSTKAPIFDIVYPGVNFAEAFQRDLERAIEIKRTEAERAATSRPRPKTVADASRLSVPAAEPEIVSLPGLDRAVALQVAAATGIDTIGRLACATTGDLVGKVPRMTKDEALKLIALATKHVAGATSPAA